jgi:hypothetical protein
MNAGEIHVGNPLGRDARLRFALEPPREELAYTAERFSLSSVAVCRRPRTTPGFFVDHRLIAKISSGGCVP